MRKMPQMRENRRPNGDELTRRAQAGGGPIRTVGGGEKERDGAGGGEDASLRLRTGDVLFEKIRMLHACEFDREAVFEVAHDAARGLAEGNQHTDLGPVLARDRRAGE